MEENYHCHDCDKLIEVEGEQIKNGHLLDYKDGEEIIQVFKCKECFEKNPALTNFRECEVYSRIVGYLRPVQQWNPGKKEEFKDRVDYKPQA